MNATTHAAPPDRLRPIDKTDLAQVLEWRNSPEVRAFMYTSREISRDEHAVWFKLMQRDPTRHTWIFEAAGVPTGVVNLTGIDATVREAHWGFYVRPGAPKGSGTRLGQLALAEAFGPLSLNRLIGEVLASNDASLRFHRKLGFEHERIIYGHHTDGEIVHDVHVFSLRRQAWLRGCAASERTQASTGEMP